MLENLFRRLVVKREEPAPHPFDSVDIGVIRRSEDGSEMLYGLARELEAAGMSRSYIAQVREAAHAIRELTALHADSGTLDEDTAYGAMEHAGRVRQMIRSATR